MAAPVDFVREVRPIFEKHCADCHGEKKQKGGLRLDVKEAALKGGDNQGPNIIPAKAKESSLIHFITSNNEDEMMPPKGERLSAAQIATLTAWINEGAVWSDGVDVEAQGTDTPVLQGATRHPRANSRPARGRAHPRPQPRRLHLLDDQRRREAERQPRSHR